MKKSFLLFLSALSLSLAALSQKSFTEKEIIASMDANAAAFLKISKANAVSIGIVKDGKTYTRHYGELDKGKGNRPNNTTLYEIASITKLFTGLLMAQAVVDGKVDLNDDIRKYISGSYPNLEYKGTPVTIKDLVSLKSGFGSDLPDLTEIFKGSFDTIPFKIKALEEAYTKEQFMKELKSVRLDTFPGKVYQYNNGSVQLAAHIIEKIYGKSYEALLKEYIFVPLGIKNTKLFLDPKDSLARGYNEKNLLMPSMPNSLWNASGSLKSTLEDLLKFLQFELNSSNPVVKESQRDLLNNKTSWNGYFWDEVTMGPEGRNARKHGGAFAIQNMFWIFPDQQLGVSVITNQSAMPTAGQLHDVVKGLVKDLRR